MKNNLIILFLFSFSVGFGQQIDSCDEVNSDYAIRRNYQRMIDRNLEILEVFTLSFDAEVSKIPEFIKWAKSKGYITIIDSVCRKHRPDFKTIEITEVKPLPSLAYYTSVWKEVMDKKRELGINDCIYSGARFMSLPSKGPCSGMYVDSVYNKYYNRSLKNNITAADTIKFRFSADSAVAIKIKDWAMANNFTVYPEVEVTTSNPEGKLLQVVFTKQLREPLYDFFASTLKQVAKMREEYKIEKCGDYYVSYRLAH